MVDIRTSKNGGIHMGTIVILMRCSWILGSEKLVFDGDLTIKIMDLIWLCLNKTGICVDHLRFGTDRGYGLPVGLNPSSGPEFSSRSHIIEYGTKGILLTYHVPRNFWG
jgi:hypothetical protein